MADQSDGAGKLVWFIAGAAIGAAIALLYAPASGAETRRKLVKRTEEGRSAIVDSSKDIYERGKDLYDKGKKIADEAAELFDRGRRLVQG